MLAWTSEGDQEVVDGGDAHHPGQRLGEHDPPEETTGLAEDREPTPDARARVASVLDVGDHRHDQRPREQGQADLGLACVLEEEPPVDRGQPRIDLVGREDADRQRPDHEAASDDRVQQRLGQRASGRGWRSLRPPSGA